MKKGHLKIPGHNRGRYKRGSNFAALIKNSIIAVMREYILKRIIT